MKTGRHRLAARRVRAWRASLAGMVISVSAAAVAAAAGQAEWSGSDVVNDRPSAVRLAADGTLASAERIRMRFGAPRNCAIEARRMRTEEVALRYAITDSSGGVFCDALYPGTLELTERDDALMVEVVGTQGRRPISLHRLGTPAAAGQVDPRRLLGVWSGREGVDRGAVDATLSVNGVEPGDEDNTLRYEGSRRCGMALGYEGAGALGFYFSIRLPGSSGGYCDRLLGRYLVVQPEEHRLRYRFEPADRSCANGCALDVERRR